MNIQKLATICGVFAGCLLLSACSGGGPEGVVKSFYKALDKGEVSAAREHLSRQLTEMLGGAKLDAALGAAAGKIRECGGIDDLEVALVGEGELRSGSSTMSFKGECEPEQEDLNLVKEDGSWKITARK